MPQGVGRELTAPKMAFCLRKHQLGLFVTRGKVQGIAWNGDVLAKKVTPM